MVYRTWAVRFSSSIFLCRIRGVLSVSVYVFIAELAKVIAIDFPAGFILGGTWATADFDLIDGAARTVDAVNAGPGVSTVGCADGPNNIGVAVDTAAGVFRAIPCGRWGLSRMRTTRMPSTRICWTARGCATT